MGTVANYKDLLVWQRSMDLVEKVYRIARKLPDNKVGRRFLGGKVESAVRIER